MKKLIIIGSGIAGLSCAIRGAEAGFHVVMYSPFPSERSQSVMAAGGINAVINGEKNNDSAAAHAEDTFRGGGCIDSRSSILKLCEAAPEEIAWLDSIGVVFNRTDDGSLAQRALGGHSGSRTCFAGAATGKQIVSALVYRCRAFEESGRILRRYGRHFHSALIKDGKCYGCLLLDERTGEISAEYGDALCIATGGQNALFGKTTGSTLCDGYAAARLFTQGVALRNLEFIQYHPTTLETPHKRMLISEAARGEGGRLYYEENGTRRYFMEEMFGPKGNLKPRDVVSKCIYDVKTQVYLDISFLGEEKIHQRLEEIYDVCRMYADIDVTNESIPVYPSVHFFMGGIDVDDDHCTAVRGLYAIGECAGKYHGANRLGGNSLLSALYSGRACIEGIMLNDDSSEDIPDFSEYISAEKAVIAAMTDSKSKYPIAYVERELASVMSRDLGITRTQQGLEQGLESIDFYRQAVDRISFDPDVSLYRSLRIKYMLILAEAILKAADARKESRGAHIREDFPAADERFAASSIAGYDNGEINISFRKENRE